MAGSTDGTGRELGRPPADRATLFGVVRGLIGLLREERPARWLAVLFLAVVASGVEALAAALIFVLLSMVTGSDDVALPIVGDLRTQFSGADTQTLFIVVSAVIALFFAFRAALLVLQAYVQHRVTLHAGVRLARRMFSGYLEMPYEFHLHRNSSDLIRNCHEAISLLTRDVLHPGTRVVSEALIMLGIVGVLLWTAPLASVLAVGVLGSVAVLLLRVVHPHIDRFGALHHAMASQVFKTLQQGFGGIREISVIGCQPAFLRSYVSARRQLARANYIKSTLSEVPRAALEAVLVFFIVGLFLYSVATAGSALAAVPVLGVFAYAALRLKPSLTVIIRGFNSVRFAGPAVLHLKDELDSFEGSMVRRPDRGRGEPLSFVEELRFEGVSFTYHGSGVPALHDIDLRIRAGQAVGVVGPTGAGKSTFLDLILGLLTPTSGRITVDGVDIRDALAQWRENLGVVPQSVFLIDDTLKRNIAFGIPDGEIDEDRVRRAVSLAQLDTFVGELPDGLETQVGERGVRISGGQRQRIAIARALYQDPSVLVFDEGTSALDNKTESEFMAALRRLRGSRTIVMVAHRLSTVRDCDQIVVIENGQVVDVGTFDQLMDHSEAFRQLAWQPR